MNTLAYQQNCLTRPIVTSVTLGGIFTGLSVVQGARFTPQLAALNVGGLYVYNILQCPMEAFHGRSSAWHNVASASILGYVGVARGVIGIPFVDSYFFMRYPQISAPMAGAAVFGSISFLMTSVLGGKPF
jgi:hypothetical protein